MTSWIYLIIAGLLEVCFASMIKLTDNFTKIVPTFVFLIFAIGSFFMLTKAIENIPVGTAYAIWTGIGVVGTSIIGIIFYNDPLNVLRIVFLSTLIISIIGLKLVS